MNDSRTIPEWFRLRSGPRVRLRIREQGNKGAGKGARETTNPSVVMPVNARKASA